jgi:hypothetical protein
MDRQNANDVNKDNGDDDADDDDAVAGHLQLGYPILPKVTAFLSYLMISKTSRSRTNCLTRVSTAIVQELKTHNGLFNGDGREAWGNLVASYCRTLIDS